MERSITSVVCRMNIYPIVHEESSDFNVSRHMEQGIAVVFSRTCEIVHYERICEESEHIDVSFPC
jgi:hypothetical protein